MSFLLLAQEAADVVASDSAGASSSVTVHSDYGLLAILIAGLVGLVVLIGFGVAIANGSRPLSMARSLAGLMGMAWVAPMLAGIVWFGYAHSDVFQTEYLETNPNYQPGDVTFSPSPQNRRIESADGEELEPWVLAGQQTQGRSLLIPVHSDWRATDEEARTLALQHATDVVREELQLTYPAARRFSINRYADELFSIKSSTLETKETEVLDGGLTTTMYRSHLLVEISDATRTRLVTHWKTAQQQSRLTVLTAGGLLLTLLWIASAAYLRFDLHTESRYRGWLKTAATAAVLAGVLIAHGWLSAVANYQAG